MAEFCQGKINGQAPYYIPRPCSRKAVRDGYCGTHHPEAQAERRAKSRVKSQAAHEARMKAHDFRTRRPADYRDALKRIAAGAENASEIARHVLLKWDEDE